MLELTASLTSPSLSLPICGMGTTPEPASDERCQVHGPGRKRCRGGALLVRGGLLVLGVLLAHLPCSASVQAPTPASLGVLRHSPPCAVHQELFSLLSTHALCGYCPCPVHLRLSPRFSQEPLPGVPVSSAFLPPLTHRAAGGFFENSQSPVVVIPYPTLSSSQHPHCAPQTSQDQPAPCSLALPHTLSRLSRLQPPWPPSCSAHTLSMFLPQSLCPGCSLAPNAFLLMATCPATSPPSCPGFSVTGPSLVRLCERTALLYLLSTRDT